MLLTAVEEMKVMDVVYFDRRKKTTVSRNDKFVVIRNDKDFIRIRLIDDSKETPEEIFNCKISKNYKDNVISIIKSLPE